MDHIDNYRSAIRRKFKESGDSKIRRVFYCQSRADIDWGHRNGLIKDMSFEDYLEANLNKSKRVITDEERAVITHDANIPTWILSRFYELHPSTIANIRRKAKLELSPTDQ